MRQRRPRQPHDLRWKLSIAACLPGVRPLESCSIWPNLILDMGEMGMSPYPPWWCWPSLVNSGNSANLTFCYYFFRNYLLDAVLSLHATATILHFLKSQCRVTAGDFLTRFATFPSDSHTMTWHIFKAHYVFQADCPASRKWNTSLLFFGLRRKSLSWYLSTRV